MTALITGASTGIGKELAVQFAQDNIDLVLVARNEKKLQENAKSLTNTYGISVSIIALDLSTPESANVLYKKVQALGHTIHYLVNNAGFGTHGDFVASDLLRQESMINLNILTLTKLTHLYANDMKMQKKGTILNVASTAAFQPGPLMSVYFATKHYVLAFSEAIAEELKPYNVHVCTLCPGPTESGFGVVAGFGMLENAAPNKFPSSAEVAQFAYSKMKKKKTVFIHGWGNALLANSIRFLPRSVVRKIAHYKMK